MTYYVRNPGSVVTTGGDAILILDGGNVHALTDVDHEQLSSLLEATCRPIAEDVLLERIDRSGLDTLLELGLLVAGSHEEVQALIAAGQGGGALIGDRLVVGLTGAISAAEMVGVISYLRQRCFKQVDVILTNGAQRFLQNAPFEYYGIPVWTDEFQIRGDIKVPHIHLAKQAQVVLVMPASAHTIHKLASADCSDLLSLVVTATRAPVVIVPSMNDAMWCNPGVRHNVQRLRENGYCVVEPSYGIEVSSGLDSEAGLGGPGVSPQNLALLLAAVCKTRAAR